jgi:GT2 family glycosyltransferase
MASHRKPDLTIIILSFNVKELLLNCLKTLYNNKTDEDLWQVIVVDNASSDQSLADAKNAYPEIEAIQTGKNLGFAGGNNTAIPHIKSDYVLFLNPDTEVVGDVIQKSLEFLKSDPQIGGLSCRVELPDGRLDYSCHRGFPTPWNSFCYFTGLTKLFPKSKLFAGYTASFLDISKTHEMDCGNGTFLMLPKEVGEKVRWWDTDYFWNGEDIEFFYRIKDKGYKVFYFAEGKIIHYKGSSSGLWSTAKVKVEKSTKIKAAKAGIKAMRIFFMKHYYNKYPIGVRHLILAGIRLLEYYRLFRINAGMK